MKNKLAASYESILIKLDDITFSQLGFSKYVTNIMLERYSYNCFLNVYRTRGRPQIIYLCVACIPSLYY